MARAEIHPIFSFTHTILQIIGNFKVFLAKTVICEGILSIQAGESPALIERKLQSFILSDGKSAKKEG